jgi:hypothetical protein
MKTFVGFFFPRAADNRFEGPSWIQYIFYGFTGLMLWRSQHHIFSDDGGSHSVAGIPIDTFSRGGAESIIGLFAQWGISQLLLASVFLLIAFRYRALIPLMFLIAWIENLFRLGVGLYKPIGATDPPGLIGSVIFSIVIPLVLLLCFKAYRDSKKSTESHLTEISLEL